MIDKQTKKRRAVSVAREYAYIAVFIAILIAVQVVLSFVPGVELVTVLLVCFSFVMGVRRGLISATAFSLVRQIVFGFYPKVLILYLVYYNLLTLIFGLLGRKIKRPLVFLPLIVVVACLCTVSFTMFDNVLTPLWYGYSEKVARIYFYYSLPFMIPQVICTAVSVTALFYPLYKVFDVLRRKLIENERNSLQQVEKDGV